MGHYDNLNTNLSAGLYSEILNRVITSSPQCCSFKHPVTKKYLLVNQAFVEKLAIPKRDIIDHDFQDLIGRQDLDQCHHLNIKILNEINRLDQYVCEQKKTISSEKNIFPYRGGILLVENYIKIPIFDSSNNVAGILSYAQDITAQCNLFSLLPIYQCCYPLQIAHKCFLKYLNIDRYFTQTPTSRELMSLLAMFLDSSHKHVAKLLKVKTKTAETHIYQLKNKLQGASLTDILKIVRSSNRNISVRKEIIE